MGTFALSCLILQILNSCCSGALSPVQILPLCSSDLCYWNHKFDWCCISTLTISYMINSTITCIFIFTITGLKKLNNEASGPFNYTYLKETCKWIYESLTSSFPEHCIEDKAQLPDIWILTRGQKYNLRPFLSFSVHLWFSSSALTLSETPSRSL